MKKYIVTAKDPNYYVELYYQNTYSSSIKQLWTILYRQYWPNESGIYEVAVPYNYIYRWSVISELSKLADPSDPKLLYMCSEIDIDYRHVTDWQMQNERAIKAT